MSANSHTKSVIIRNKVREFLEPVTPTAIQAMNEIQLLKIVLSFGSSGILVPMSDVIEAYEALRRIDMVRYPEIDFEKEKLLMGINSHTEPEKTDPA